MEQLAGWLFFTVLIVVNTCLHILNWKALDGELDEFDHHSGA